MRTGNSKRKLPCLTTGQGLAAHYYSQLSGKVGRNEGDIREG